MNNEKHSHIISRAVCLLPEEEQRIRLDRIRQTLGDKADGILLRDNANIYYTTGRVFSGYVYIPADATRDALYFVKRPNDLEGSGVVMIRKPEDIPGALVERGYPRPATLALELGSMSYQTATRLMAAFGISAPVDGSAAMRAARAVKTAYEQSKLRESGIQQARVYAEIPGMYSRGMTDLELQIAIETTSRLAGCLGQFRVAGDEMELFMGNVLTGENADTPSPYDFAMGGAGQDPSIPVGANGTVIRPGEPVMVDVNGNYTGYMTDMTRCFSDGPVSDLCRKANDCSRAICAALAEMGRPGVEAKALYEKAFEIAKEWGLADNFMGHRSHAGFVGHGVGIEVNELPVIAPRSRDVLQAGNVIALEPKFVLPGIGAAGIENTYIVRPDGPMERITVLDENIVEFEL